jgi:uncharacterized protein YgbK (DUF1537 family)
LAAAERLPGLVGVAPPGVAIAADDLTGAADSVAAFAARGWRASVALGAAEPPEPGEARAADTCSRRDGLGEAAADVAAVLAAAGLPFLKVDSLLRGRFESDLALLLAAREWPAVVFCPALPELGRAFRGAGVLAELRPAYVRAGEEMPEGLVVADADSAADLDALVAAAPRGTLWVGSAGLAHALARAHGGAPSAAELPRVAGEILVVVGSRAERARRQLARLEGSGATVASVETGAGAEDVAVVGRLARNLAPRAAAAGALVATGGDTARALLDALGVERLDVLGELEPGVVASRVPDGPIVVTKAGSFGDDGTLARVVARLRG